ncbi:amino acid permease [Rhizodiscina lignyota]|uniref:Amino acid permease n=1 Tax=Rhizodiscina lignyota TaxID=1504668 RepID=A0A9P4I615_9PEZI|nr:amino acid permease [Rhizodiscina lignyota]
MKPRRPSSNIRRTSVHEDAAQLAAFGHQQELKRNFSFISMLGLGFAILNSWTALAASLSLALPSGGPTSVIWGLVTAGICNLCLAASLAEFLSAFPTSAGQYHWAAIVSPRRWVPITSWITGWINTAGWIALTATGGLLGSQLVVGIISFMNASYSPQRWHQFLIYVGYNIFSFLVNAFLTSTLPLVTKSAFIWSILGFVVISITVLACASPNYQSGDFVYRDFINQTGWPDGLAWLLGLLQGGLGLTGFDAVAHMIEEIPQPTIEGPKIMIFCVGIGLFTGFVFLSVLLFVLKDVNNVIDSAAGPVLQIFYDATGNKAGSICLLMFPLVCLLFATTSIMTTSSRMTYAFARDGGLPFSKFFAKVHPKLNVPLNALYLTTGLVIIFGCIFLGSSSAFNAIVSASVVALGITYAIPPAINCIRGRKMLPETRAFVLPGPWGWVCNLIGIAYTILTTVLFVFPPALPVTGSNMNYCIAAFAIILIISVFQWYIDGRKNFNGPYIDESVFKVTYVDRLDINTVITPAAREENIDEDIPSRDEKFEEEEEKSIA